MSLRLDWCGHDAAKWACEHWHYAGVLPTPPYNRVGVWERDRYIGCVLFSRGATQNIGRPFGLALTEVAELTRVALADHATPVSRILAVAVRFLRRRSPGLRLLISYADPAHGHHGGIYQASGWFYLGQRNVSTEYVGPDGKRWHARMVSPTGRKKVYGRYRPVYRPDQCRAVACPGKHKYALPLDAAMRAQLAPLARPYPRRQPLESEGPPDQGGHEGAAMRPVGSTMAVRDGG
jgi:hypothetical protein